MSMNKDNSHSWVRTSHGLNKLVTDFIDKEYDDNEQEPSEMQFEDYALRLNASDFACRSKAKAKTQRRTSASSSTRTFPIRERIWTDVEPGESSISDYEVSKKLIRLIRHGNLPGQDDGATEFWRIKDHFQKHFLYCHHWSDDKWKKSMAGGGGGNKKRYQYCTDSSGAILYFRALQGHSGRSLIDPSLQDTTRSHSTSSNPHVHRSWRSDAPIILPGWECHTGGSRSKPTVHRCRPKTGGCGLLAEHHTKRAQTTQSTLRNYNMVAEHERSLGANYSANWRSVQAFLVCAMQSKAMTSSVSSSARRHHDSGNTVTAEAPWQCKLEYSTDKMVGNNEVLTVRCRWNGTLERRHRLLHMRAFLAERNRGQSNFR